MSGFDHKAFLPTVSTRAGVYRMYDASDVLLYVGKARNLKKRLSSYFTRATDNRVATMVSQIARIEYTITHTENEALLLENQLIKAQSPRYNVLLRDDKSYPYLYLSAHEYPRLSLHRGARREDGEYFGPYASAGAVRQTMALLQKALPVRQCQDSYFRNRSRPCLQYQIKRCSGPCVGLISIEDYARDVRHLKLFLQGRDSTVVEELGQAMEAAAAELDFETAAVLRDRIAAVKQVQTRQHVAGAKGDFDLAACKIEAGVAAVQLVFVRHGQNLGSKVFFPKLPPDIEEASVIAAFLSQYYVERPAPPEILVSHLPTDTDWLAAALAGAGRNVRIRQPQRGDGVRWIRDALENADIALRQRLADKAGTAARWEALAAACDRGDELQRIECFDVSHSMGERPVASCVVVGREGLISSDYRRFNLRDITPGDDYAGMAQALERRYSRVLSEDGVLPDLVLIDGGKGQIGRAREVLAELQLDELLLLGITKGEGRRAQFDRILDRNGIDLHLPPDSPAMHLLQQARDEAHRFAITGHRGRRAKARKESPLEAVPGLGPKRRRDLLKHFGGWQGIQRAAVDDLVRVPGISRVLAQRIYDVVHG